MRRPRFFPRRVPRPLPPAPTLADPVPVARRLVEILPPLIEDARAAGLTMLAYNLWMAAHEAEGIARRAAGGIGGQESEDRDEDDAGLP